MFEGEAIVAVFENGVPAQGSVLFKTPSGVETRRVLELDGSTAFVFNEVGEWRVSFKNVGKRVFVKARQGSPAFSGGVVEVGSKTGLTVFGVSPFTTGIAFLALLVLGFVLWKTLYAVVRVRKVFDGHNVVLEVVNREGDLSSVELVDVNSEGFNAVGFTEEPVVEDTIAGKVFRWRKSVLRKGETWRIEYFADEGDASDFRKTGLSATDARGLKKSFEAS